MLGEHQTACQYFEAACASAAAGPFDPSQETLHSHLLFSLRDMYPYQSYYRAVISGLMEPERAFTDARRIIAASARTYLALRDLQLGTRMSAALPGLSWRLRTGPTTRRRRDC